MNYSSTFICLFSLFSTFSTLLWQIEDISGAVSVLVILVILGKYLKLCLVGEGLPEMCGVALADPTLDFFCYMVGLELYSGEIYEGKRVLWPQGQWSTDYPWSEDLS